MRRVLDWANITALCLLVVWIIYILSGTREPGGRGPAAYSDGALDRPLFFNEYRNRSVKPYSIPPREIDP